MRDLSQPVRLIGASYSFADYLTVARFGLRVLARVGFTMFVLHALTFVFFDILPSPALKLGGLLGVDPVVQAALNARFDLVGSAWERYGLSVQDLLHLNFGQTVSGYPVGRLLWGRAGVSASYLTVGFILCFGAGAVGVGHLTRKVPMPLLLLGRVLKTGYVPPFIIAVIFNALFLYAAGMVAPEVSNVVRTFFIALSAALLPMAVLATSSTAAARVIVSAPYFRTMESIGLSPARMRWLACRNLWAVLSPIVGRLVTLTALGSIFAESIFDVRGFGSLFAEALRSGDLRLMQGWILAVGLLIAVFHKTE